MKAYVLNGINQLEYMDVPMPELRSGEVLVEVKAVGICGSDIPRIYETGTYHFPTIPGHEFAGVVHSVYDNSLQKWIGKRVGVFPLIPCKECLPCRNKQYEMCRHYDYLGSRRDGGFAEYVVVPVWNLIELPDNISFEVAAMLEPASVGIHALRQMNISKVQSATVFGPGTIGMLTAQWLRAFGVHNIYIVGTKDEQRVLAEKLGFVKFINGKASDPAQEIGQNTNGVGTDLAIECTGYADVICQCLDVVKRGGDVVVIGNPHGDMCFTKDSCWKILRKQIHIHGTWNSSFIPEDANDDWRGAIEAIVSNKIIPEKQITHRISFDDLKEGLELMKEKKEYYNKVMIVR